MNAYKVVYERQHPGVPVVSVLTVSGALPAGRLATLDRLGVDIVFDGPMLRAAAPNLPWPALAAVQSPTAAGGPATPNVLLAMLADLDTVPRGKPGWSAYQRSVRDVLAAMLTPPLEQPLSENENDEKTNRRDIILPNYATDDFWSFLRAHYAAHFLVADAKNYAGQIKKNDILQLANYLSSRGAGLFGIIVCRGTEAKSAFLTRREQ